MAGSTKEIKIEGRKECGKERGKEVRRKEKKREKAGMERNKEEKEEKKASCCMQKTDPAVARAGQSGAFPDNISLLFN